MVLNNFLLLSASAFAISPIKKLLEVLMTINDTSVAALVDSGATNNFMSRATAESFNLKIIPSDGITVRLADGQTVQTKAYAVADVRLGELSTSLRFEILSEDIAIILGMPFLEVANPQINWKQKSIKIKHKGRLINIPTPPAIETKQAGDFASDN